MKTLQPETKELIQDELESIPKEYHKNFNSVHEGYAVLLEEVRELESEVFFGRKKAQDGRGRSEFSDKVWKKNIREEAVQVAAMAVRIIQELT